MADTVYNNNHDRTYVWMLSCPYHCRGSSVCVRIASKFPCKSSDCKYRIPTADMRIILFCKCLYFVGALKSVAAHQVSVRSMSNQMASSFASIRK